MNGDRGITNCSVAVCIATYRRPEGLKALMESLNQLRFEQMNVRVILVIVDNDPSSPAFADHSDAARFSRWPVKYVYESVQGIVSARNRALAEVPPDCDYVAFVDDDETVSSTWLEALISTQRATRAAAVQGPMVPVYEAEPPDWIRALRIFDIGPFVQAEKLNFAATGNSLVDYQFARSHNLRFDEAFNQSGGEDEEFFGRLRNAGGEIRAAADAVVYDQVPNSRLSPHWVLRRAFRRGNTLSRVALKRRRGRLLRFAKSFGAMGRGALILLLRGLFSATDRMRGLMEIWRGAGMLAAFFQINIHEYNDENVMKDRKAGN